MRFSRHIEEVFSVLRRGRLRAFKNSSELVIARLDTYPEDGDEDIIFLSNGKRITVTDLEFAEVGHDNVTLGDYLFKAEG